MCSNCNNHNYASRAFCNRYYFKPLLFNFIGQALICCFIQQIWQLLNQTYVMVHSKFTFLLCVLLPKLVCMIMIEELVNALRSCRAAQSFTNSTFNYGIENVDWMYILVPCNPLASCVAFQSCTWSMLVTFEVHSDAY